MYIKRLLSCCVLLSIAAGCGKEDSDITWYNNRNNMVHLIADVEEAMFEGRAHSVEDALEVLKRKNPSTLRMYGADGVYVANPKVSNYTNIAGSNILFIGTARLKHNGKACFVGVRYDLKDVDLDKLPEWEMGSGR